MRTCGVCLYKDILEDRPPTAACVVAFSSAKWEGQDGILARIGKMADSQVLPLASAYCTVCRASTWLCRTDLNLSEAVLDFWRQWHCASHIVCSMQRMAESVRKRKRDTEVYSTCESGEEYHDEPHQGEEEGGSASGFGRH